MQAEEFDYKRAKGVLTLTGNAVVHREDTDVEVRADFISYDQTSGLATALGNVTFRRGTVSEWRGEELVYNFTTDTLGGRGGSRKDPSVYHEDPFTLWAEEFTQLSDGQYLLTGVRATTCDPADPHLPYSVRARKLRVWPGDRMTGYGTTIYFGRVPAFYSPIWFKNLDEERGWHFRPGYASRHGAFLLSGYRMRWNDYVRTETHIDYRGKRGFAVGQDVEWKDPNGLWSGDALLYYADDDMPYDDGETVDGSVDSDRQRLLISYDHYFTTRDYLLSEFQYLSDPDVLEDFFDSAYRTRPVPENYASLTHRARDYTATLLVRPRLNDFYEIVTRLPEGSIQFPRQRLGDSPYYYEGKSSAAYLDRLFAKGDSSADFSSARLDSRNMLLYPTKQFGFLNVIPRVGYRATYYSDTRQEVEVTTTTTTGTGTAAVTTVSTTIEDVSAGADLRNVVEFGAESSLKMFGLYENLSGRPLRHIIEPRINYTYVPTPDLEPMNIYQFDRVDSIDMDHSITFGVRNKIQAKRNRGPYDLVDVDVRSSWLIEDDGSGNDFTPLILDAELRLVRWMWFDFDARYDFEDSLLEDFNTQIFLRPGGTWSSEIEYRLRDPDSSLLSGELIYTPNAEWKFSFYGRYEFDQSMLEEVTVDAQRTMECLAWRARLGLIPSYTRSDGTLREDEWRISMELWLTDFPHIGIGGSAGG